MILKRPADQEVYEYLIDNYYTDFSIIEISKAIKKSIPMVYKSISRLKSKGMIKEHGTRYKVDILNDYTLKYKYLYDYEKFLLLPDSLRNKILLLKKRLCSILQNMNFSLIIFGSLADKSFNEDSDIDILLILEKGSFDALTPLLPEGFHFLLKKPMGFLNDIVTGDDVALSICKSHIIIKDYEELFIGELKENKNKVDDSVIKFRKEEAKDLRKNIMDLYLNNLKNKKYEITRKLILEKLQKLIKIEAKIICLEHNIIPTSKINSFEEASKILKRDIKKEYSDINLENVIDKVKSYV